MNQQNIVVQEHAVQFANYYNFLCTKPVYALLDSVYYSG